MLYQENTANYPRLSTDSFFADYNNRWHYTGLIDKAMHFTKDKQLLRTDLWKRFVQQFLENPDVEDAGWRCEYWGKMMRGACFVYSYLRDAALYDVLAQTIRDMMAAAEDDGRISSYDREHEFDGWDIWGRKYVLLGMQYFLEICEDEQLTAEVIRSMCGQVDYIMSKIGSREDGKLPITEATRHWLGLNSSSLLEPIVRLYSLTKERKYLDFATYIVDCGGTSLENIFDLAYNDDFYPYQYPATKAYEMTSCFEGLLEYYRIVGNERHKTAVINFANKILESDFTVIGCCGCTHELFDHSTVRQANTTNGVIMQETCVTVTLMKFFYQLNLLTGDSRYADAFEISLYNAYLGAFNTEGVIEPTIQRDHSDWAIEALPFDSYSPLTAGTRGNGIGGLKPMSDNHYYGCCACIGAAGIGLVPKLHVLTAKDGLVMNLYLPGEVRTTLPDGTAVTLQTETAYPKCGEVKVTVKADKPTHFTLRLRIPAWSKKTTLTVCGEQVSVSEGYTAITRDWHDGDSLTLTLDMTTELLRPIPYGTDILMNKVVWGHNAMVATFDREDPLAHRHFALRRGPIMLAQEARLGYDLHTPVTVQTEPDGTVAVQTDIDEIAPYEHIIEVAVPLTDGNLMHLTDYASAGKLWTKESEMAVWMLGE